MTDLKKLDGRMEKLEKLNGRINRLETSVSKPEKDDTSPSEWSTSQPSESNVLLKGQLKLGQTNHRRNCGRSCMTTVRIRTGGMVNTLLIW